MHKKWNIYSEFETQAMDIKRGNFLTKIAKG